MRVESSYLLSIAELRALPRWAAVSFAARCARRVQPLFGSTYTGHEQRHRDHSLIEHDIAVAEISAAHGLRRIKSSFFAANTFNTIEAWIENSATAAYQSAYYQGSKERAAKAAHRAAYAAGRAMTAAFLEARHGRYGYASEFDSAFVDGIPRDAYTAIRSDFEMLLNLADLHGWDDSTAVPVNLFYTRDSATSQWAEEPGSTVSKGAKDRDSVLSQEINKRNIVQVSTVLNRALIQQIRQDPARLHALTSRQFEEMVAELFNGFGFEVELTKATRDGGRDVVAVGGDIAEVKYVIECKRYTRKRAVGVNVIREIHGVAMDEGATKGIVATTSRFTKDAIRHIQRNRYRLEGRDFNGVVEWLERYDAVKGKWASGA